MQKDSCEQFTKPLHGGTTVDFMSDKTFREVYQAWAIKLDLSYEFSCPICDDSPDVLICDATSTSILSKYYTGTPIKAADQHTDRAQRPHTKAERSLFPNATSCKLSDFATYVRADGLSAFGHRSEGGSFQYEQDAPDLVELLEAAEGMNMADLISDIGDLCNEQPRADN